MKKQEVIAAILACAEKLGYVPTIPELMKHKGIDRPEIRKHFGNYTQALEECGLETPGWAKTVSPQMRFQDWMEVARKLKRLPSIFDYERLGKYSAKSVTKAVWLMAAGPAGDEALCRRARPGRRMARGAGDGGSTGRRQTRKPQRRPVRWPAR